MTRSSRPIRPSTTTIRDSARSSATRPPKSAAAILAKAGSTDTEKLIAAAEGISVPSPFGEITFRKIDHQSTLGAFVGTTALKDGKGIMVDSVYRKGSDYLPSDAEVEKLRPND